MVFISLNNFDATFWILLVRLPGSNTGYLMSDVDLLANMFLILQMFFSATHIYWAIAFQAISGLEKLLVRLESWQSCLTLPGGLFYQTLFEENKYLPAVSNTYSLYLFIMEVIQKMKVLCHFVQIDYIHSEMQQG